MMQSPWEARRAKRGLRQNGADFLGEFAVDAAGQAVQRLRPNLLPQLDWAKLKCAQHPARPGSPRQAMKLRPVLHVQIQVSCLPAEQLEPVLVVRAFLTGQFHVVVGGRIPQTVAPTAFVESWQRL